MKKTYSYYENLKKPSFSPPSWVFAPVWTILYIVIFFSFWKVFLMFLQNQIPLFIASLFLLNLISNLIFTPIQFWLKNNFLAMIDVFLVLITLILATIFIYPYSNLISYLQIPYILWVSFATFLQVRITFLNRKKW
jgi:tryptophan-rich sensory protein